MNRDQLLKLITISDTGLYDEKKTFKVRDNVLCVFAVISSSNADAVNKIDKNTDPILPKRFLHLAGVASKGPNHGFSAYFSLSE